MIIEVIYDVKNKRLLNYRIEKLKESGYMLSDIIGDKLIYDNKK